MNECEDCDRLDCRERGCIAPVQGTENMKIRISKPVEVEPATMTINIKVRDEFAFVMKDTNGNIIAEQDDGYVPAFMPGDDSDYVDLEIDVRSGKITNWLDSNAFVTYLQRYIDDKGQD